MDGTTDGTKDGTTDGGFPIFVLTLAGEEARRAPLIARLEALGLDHELVFGIDGRRGLTAAEERLIDRPGTVRRIWKTLSDAEYACALSHQMIYRRVIEDGLPGCIVLEDDAALTDGFAAFVTDRVYLRHDMMLLFHHGGLRRRGAPLALAPGVKAWRIAAPPMGSSGYAVSARAARAIRRRGLPIRGTADWPCNIARLDCVAVSPRLVELPENPPPSLIEAHRDVDIIPQSYPKLRGLLSLDKWRQRLWSRLGTPLEDQ